MAPCKADFSVRIRTWAEHRKIGFRSKSPKPLDGGAELN